LKVRNFAFHLPLHILHLDAVDTDIVSSRAYDFEPKSIMFCQLLQHSKDRLQIRKRRMGSDPAKDEWFARSIAGRRAKDVSIDDRRYDARRRAPAGNILSNGAISAGHHRGPADQIIGLAEPFQGPSETSVCRASI